jgi:hopanoid biosynthesis associated membrane protein HpnM
VRSDGTGPGSASRRRFVQGGVACACGLLATPPLHAQDAAAPVERLHEALLTAATEGDTPRARYAHLLPVVSDVFDFRAMSRAAVGRVWSDFSDAERAALIERFAAYATANYARRFDGGGNVSFRTVTVEPGRGQQVHVETELVRSRKEPISFDYLVFRGSDGPRIVNVVVAGTFNQFARRRSEFRSLLQAGGLSHLLETLEQQTRALVS